MGKSTISMAIFNSYVSHYQRVGFGLTSSVASLKPPRFPWRNDRGLHRFPAQFGQMPRVPSWFAQTGARLGAESVGVSGLWGTWAGNSSLEWVFFVSEIPGKSFEQDICPKIAKDQIHDFVEVVVGLPISKVVPAGCKETNRPGVFYKPTQAAGIFLCIPCCQQRISWILVSMKS